MTKEKTKYYSLDAINSHKDCRYKILFGMRANGKSYAVKSHALKEAWDNKAMTFAIIRRMDSDIKTELIESYFADMYPYIKKLTKDEYNYISVYRSRIYLAKIDEDEGVTRGICVGKVFALSLDERYKSGAYPDIKTIIYEEFITNRLYLKNEVTRLMNLVSTILRRREGNVYLVGNTINRQNPYFFEWGLKNIPKQAINTIDIYTLKGLDDTEVKIAVEYCGVAGDTKSGMFFGNSAKSIDGGAWETREWTHLPKDFKEYELLYSLQLVNADYKFTLAILSDEETTLLYIYPASYITHDRIIQNTFSIDFLKSPSLMKMNKAECLISDLWHNNKVCYANNLCGEDFNQSISMMGSPLSLL